MSSARSVLGMLSDPGSVYDGGLKVRRQESVWRGLKTGGTTRDVGTGRDPDALD